MDGSLPHPFAHGEILEGEVLGILECKKEQIEDCFEVVVHARLSETLPLDFEHHSVQV